MFACILPVFGLPLQLSPALIDDERDQPRHPGAFESGVRRAAFHYFCKQALLAQGVPQATAIGYAILVHLTFYVPVTLWGAAAILWYGVQVGATAAMARAAKGSPQTDTVGGVPVRVIARRSNHIALRQRPPRSSTSRSPRRC